MPSLKVIFEDADLLVIDKPAGISIHPDNFNKEPTVVDWLLVNCPEVVGVGEQPERPGIVHRLDKDTSGVLLVAKNQKTFEFLKQLFQTGSIAKKYWTLVYGHPPGGVIDLPIGRSRKDPRRRLAGKGASGKLREAKTLYRVVEELGPYSLLEVSPKTGRTHQIRVHFKAIQTPVVCDALYTPGKVCPAPLARHALHAGNLEFVDWNGQKRSFTSPLPADLSQTLANLRAGEGLLN